MNLLVLMYHRARAAADGNSEEMLDAHFRHVAARCRNVLPGEAIAGGRINVCLSFDDGYSDFHSVVYPLLRKHGLRAVLAVPVGVVRCRAAPWEAEQPAGGFCTWPELGKMADSGHVEIAAHGFNHVPLDSPESDLGAEIHTPGAVLGERLGRRIDSFVFPYGRYSPRSLAEARRSYRYVFRIGGAANRSWSGRLLYRVCADAMRSPEGPLSPARMAGYRARYFWNRIRRR